MIGGVALGSSLGDRDASPDVLTTSPSASASTSQVPTPTASPSTMADLPLGPGSLVPWWGDGVLHVGDEEIETDLRFPIQAGSTILVGNSAERRSVWRLVEDGALGRTVVDEPRWVRPQLSPDGRLLLVTTPADDQGLTTYAVTEVATGVLWGSVDLQDLAPGECCVGVELLMFDNDGRLAYRLGEDAYVWAPGGKPVPITGVEAQRIEPLSSTDQGYAGGLVTMGEATATSGNGGVLGSLGDDGRFTPHGVVPDSILSSFNPNGTLAAYPGNDQGKVNVTKQNTSVWVQEIDGAAPQRLGLPDLPIGDDSNPAYWFPIGWEDDSHVIVRRGDRVSDDPVQWSYQFARCDVTTLACERAGGETGPATTVEDS